MFCSKCGNQVQEGKNFCFKCGTPATQKTRNCVKCGKQLRPEAMFCAGCGQSVGAKTQQPPKRPPIIQRTPVVVPVNENCRKCGNRLKGSYTCNICGHVNPAPAVKPQPVIPNPVQPLNPIRTNANAVQPRPVQPIKQAPPKSQPTTQQVHGQQSTTTVQRRQPAIPSPVQKTPSKQPGQQTTHSQSTLVSNASINPPVAGKKAKNTFSAKVEERGRATIPKPVRDVLKLNVGDYITFTIEGNKAIVQKSQTRKGK